MASWMVHFRVADGVMDYIQNLHKDQFVVGNIGADCSEPNEDGSGFNPPSNISHWTETNRKVDINYEKFYDTYIKNSDDTERISFYLGYYVHLMTDVQWTYKIFRPTKEKYINEFTNDKNFMRKFKADWYDLEHIFLRDNPDFRAFRIFEKIQTFPNIYLEYYSEKAIEKQIKYISDFYNKFNGSLEREYPYLNKEQMDQFVDEMIEIILIDLKNKQII